MGKEPEEEIELFDTEKKVEKDIEHSNKKYRLVEKIGEGGGDASRVYKALILDNGREVIKDCYKKKMNLERIAEKLKRDMEKKGETPTEARVKEELDKLLEQLPYNEDHVAVKVVFETQAVQKPSDVQNKIMLQERKQMGIQRESSLKSLSTNPRNVTIFDTGKTYYRHSYIVEELVEHKFGKKTMRTFDPVCLPVECAVDAIIQAAEGIMHLHKNGMYHRDVKPKNTLIIVKPQEAIEEFKEIERAIKAKYDVLEKKLNFDYKKAKDDPKERTRIRMLMVKFSKEKVLSLKKAAANCGIEIDHVKNCDFDIIKKLNPSAGELQTQQGQGIAGTPEYMAPEQILVPERINRILRDNLTDEKSLKTLDEYFTRIDIYGLGASLYHLLTGETLHGVQDPIMALADGSYGKSVEMSVCDPNVLPVHPKKYNPYINRDLLKILGKCIHKVASNRYRHVKELIDDLGKWKYNRRFAQYQFWTKAFWNRQKINRPDYSPFIFTNKIDIERRRRGFIGRATQTMVLAPRIGYEKAMEKVANIENPVFRKGAEYLIYAGSAIAAAGLAAALYFGLSSWFSPKKTNVPEKDNTRIEQPIEKENEQ